MPKINKPMDVPGLNLQPPVTGKVTLSEDMQQTLALLCAMGDAQRTLIKASESGVLYTVSPRIKDVWGFKSLGDTSHKQGNVIACNEVMITGHPDNSGKIWVRPYNKYILTGDGANFAWPVAANAVVDFVVSNLNQLWFYFEKLNDIVIVVYTV